MTAPLHDLADILGSLAAESSPRARSGARALQSVLALGRVLPDWLRRELAGCAHTEPGFRVLSYVERRTGERIAPRDIASALHMTAPAVASALGRLEVSGLVTQQRCASDRSACTIAATAAGRDALSTASERLARSVRRLLGDIAPADLAALASTCDRIARASAGGGASGLRRQSGSRRRRLPAALHATA